MKKQKQTQSVGRQWEYDEVGEEEEEDEEKKSVGALSPDS